MCSTCGCGSENSEYKITMLDESHEHHHPDHHHSHKHDHEIHLADLEHEILHKNNVFAERNRGYFEALNILTLNLVSSPGSGKTTLIEETIKGLKDQLEFYIIEGDQQTENDANRIKALGIPVIQINTGKGCHLDAEMIHEAIHKLKPKANSVLIIENVGNLVCPAMFDLGEKHRVVIMSVTEGEDKPIKYPDMFAGSDICIYNKTDLLPYLDFDLDSCRDYAMRVNHHLQFYETSAKKGSGLDSWFSWISENRFEMSQ